MKVGNLRQQGVEHCNKRGLFAVGEPQKEKKKRSLIRKSAQIVLSSPGSDSPGDEEESDFEASEDSEEDDAEDLVDSEEEEEAPPVKRTRPQVCEILNAPSITCSEASSAVYFGSRLGW